MQVDLPGWVKDQHGLGNLCMCNWLINTTIYLCVLCGGPSVHLLHTSSYFLECVGVNSKKAICPLIGSA